MITTAQFELINSENQNVEFELEGLEVYSLQALKQLNGQVVKLQEDIFDEPMVGVFNIHQINNSEVDFNNPSNYSNTNIESILFSINIVDDWGQRTKTYDSLGQIKSLALLA